jgi:hypothetical protein
MSEPSTGSAQAPPEVAEVGWRVIDPDGNVVDSGPGMVLIAVAESGPDTTTDTTEES